MEVIKKFNKILLLSFTVLVLFFIVYSVFKLSLYNLIEHDDYVFFFEKGTSVLTKYLYCAYKAKFISNAIILFSGFELPCFLNIHPDLWIQTGGAVIKGIFWAVFSTILAGTCFLYNKKNFLFPFFILFTYIFIQFKYVNFFQNELYASFYCFVFPFIFFFVFWQLVIKIYTNVIPFNRANKIYLFIVGILLGMSSEITAISSFTALLCILLTNHFIKNVDKELLLNSFISTIIGNCIYFLNPIFIINANEYGTFKSFRQTIDAALEILPEYIAGYKDTFIHYFLPYLSVLVIFTVIMYLFADKTIKNKILVMTISLLIGSFSFFTMLLFAGRPMNHTAVVHYDIIVQMLILFIFLIYLQISCIINNKKVFYTAFTAISLIICIININTITKNLAEHNYYYDNLLFNYYDKYINAYKNEYLISYYSYKNMPITIARAGGYFDGSIIRKVKSLYNSNYDTNNSIKYTDTIEEALDIYYKNGGRNVSREVFEKADFQKLLDKNFVLNGESSGK